MRIETAAGVHLSEIRDSDAEALVEWLAEEDIAVWTAVIPIPYTLADAKAYLEIVRRRTVAAGRPTELAIRRADGRLIGGVGLHGWKPGAAEAEIGYWLAKPYWGKGIASAAVRAALAHGAALGVKRFTARVYAGNERSARMLEKLGFRDEGPLPARPESGGRKLDSRLYALDADGLL